ACGVPPAGTATQLAVLPAEAEEAAAWLERQGLADTAPLFGIHPGSSFGPSKLWDPARFAAVADGLHERYGGATVVLCGPREPDLARAVAGAARSPVRAAADDPLSLGAAKALVARLALLVCTDSGPRHLA